MNPLPDNLLTAWQVRAKAGEPAAVVRVNNLQTTIQATDAWGRPNKPQPAEISVEVSFRESFETSSAKDQLDSGTVHYGILSKTVLGALEKFRPGVEVDDDNGNITLRKIADTIWLSLTAERFHTSGIEQLTAASHILHITQFQYLSFTVRLPKASLLGEGVSFTVSESPHSDPNGSHSAVFSGSFRLHGLRVPTLIGVNANERLAKQILIADVEIGRHMYPYKVDIYTKLENIVVQYIQDSTFETLEALASHTANRIIQTTAEWAGECRDLIRGYHVKVSLRKPIAVSLADAPVVEVRKVDT